MKFNSGFKGLMVCLQICNPAQIYFFSCAAQKYFHRPLRLKFKSDPHLNPLNAELNPICHFLALLGAHHILHLSRIGLITCRNQILPSNGRRFFLLFWEFRKQISARRTSILPENFSEFPQCIHAVAAFKYFPSSFFIIVPIILLRVSLSKE